MEGATDGATEGAMEIGDVELVKDCEEDEAVVREDFAHFREFPENSGTALGWALARATWA